MRRCPLPPPGAAFPAALALAMLTGCGAHGPATATSVSSATQSTAPGATGRSCGMGKTAAGVPVLVEIARGSVGCGTALRLQRAYAAALASGKAPGNGGGGPVTVRGWLCAGFDTPEILRTGEASKCTKGDAEILAVLPTPSSPSS